MKMAGYYKNRPSEIDKSLLTVIPDAPRIPQPVTPNNYDWSLLEENRPNISNVISLILISITLWLCPRPNEQLKI